VYGAVYTVRSQGVALATDVNAIIHDTRPPNKLAVDSVALSNCSLFSNVRTVSVRMLSAISVSLLPVRSPLSLSLQWLHYPYVTGALKF